MKRLAGFAAVPFAIALAAAFGVPIASWAAALGMLLFVFAACALLIGAEDTGKSLMKGFLLCLIVALFASAAGAGVREALWDPVVQGVLCVLVALAAILGGAYLAAKGAALDLKRPAKPKMPLMERSAIVDPAFPSASRPASASARGRRSPEAGRPFAAGDGRTRSGKESTDDDLGLFGTGGKS